MVASLRADTSYRIGALGDKRSLGPFLALLGSVNGPALTALARTDVSAPGDVPAEDAAGAPVPQYADWRSMLAAHPEISLVVETTGRPDILADLRRGLPANVGLAEASAGEFLAHLFGADASSCRRDLLHTQSVLTGVIDQLREEIALVDDSGRVLDCNRAVLAARGLTKNEVAGRPLRRFFTLPADLAAGVRPPLEEALRLGRAAEATLPETGPDGRLRYIREYVYPLQGPDGTSRIILCIRRDITTRTRMEQHVQQAERLVTIGELSTYIAHEIRNPLMAIGGFAGQLLRGATDPLQREKIEIIIEEGRRLDALLKSILAFTQPAAPGRAEVNDIVRDALGLMELACKNRNIRPLFDLAEGLPPVLADPEVVRQCLVHLIKNAVEAMPHGGRLDVRTGLRRGRVFLEVEDTGVGLTPEALEKAFRPFFSTKGRGSGLGLSIVKKSLEDLGGAVELASLPGRGARATLLLPPQPAVAKPDANG